MTRQLRSVAVLGAGTMGSRIAAHFANAGVPAVLLDIVLPGERDRNAAAVRGLQAAAKQKPGGFFTDQTMSLVQPGNLEDHFDRITGADWIIEAVTENLEIKRNLWRRVETMRRPGTIVSTNTSGIPLARISEGFSSEFRAHFLGTHFFNPPRYLHLLEVIPGRETDPSVVEFVSDYGTRRLGKGVVICKDTPNFIANRIGSFFGSTVYKTMIEGDYTIEEVDALTGPLIGLPNSASFRLLDIVGLDVWAFVSQNLYDAVPNDPWRERFLLPDFMTAMIQRKWLGEKTGQGFFKRVGKEKEIHAIDWKTLEYHPAAKPRFPEVEAARNIEDLPARLRALVAGDTRAGRFLWKLLSDTTIYAAERIPEISDRVVEIDRAMRWGYANTLGPFELWDALGVEEAVARIRNEGRRVPDTVGRMIANGGKSFYRAADSGGNPRTQYFDLLAVEYRDIEPRPGVIVLSHHKRAQGVVKKNAGASLIDLGDGVVCLEFHTKMNAIGDDIISMVYESIEETSRNFEALVIANQGEAFSAGANLVLMLLAAQEGEWDDINAAIHRFQQANMAIKYSPRPVVAAPHGRVLGGGCEIVLHTARVQAAAELYIGQVEVGVGLIPAAGGCKELLSRLEDPRRVFELIGYAKVSSSAADARNLGFLRDGDGLSMNRELLIGDAKAIALSLVSTYAPGVQRGDIPVKGEGGFATLKVGAWMAHRGGYISEYDLVIAEKLAHVLSGGRLSGEHKVTEQYLLDLEREAFLSLLGNPKTQERIQYLLKTGKPLRN